MKNKFLKDESLILKEKLKTKVRIILNNSNLNYLKETQLKRELQDKEIIFSKLQTLERENEKLKEYVSLLIS